MDEGRRHHRIPGEEEEALNQSQSVHLPPQAKQWHASAGTAPAIKNVCLYTGTALPKIGGQEMVVDALAREYLAMGLEVVVLAPRPSKPWRLGDETLPYQVQRHPRFISTRRFVGWYRRWLANLHRRQQFDVVHAHDVYPTGYVAALCQANARLPLVITSHGDDVRPDSARLARPELRRRHVQAIDAAGALIAISQFTHEGFASLAPHAAHKIVDLHNGVAVDAFRGTAARPARLPAELQPGSYAMFLGRLDRRKGTDVLIEAVALCRKIPDLQLVIAGDGPERANWQALAASRGVDRQIHFVGMTRGEEKIYLLENARCVITPSRAWEGMPLVVLEAFAARQPVIASRLPGFIDLVTPETTGFLVPPESPAPLAALLEEVWPDQSRLRTLGENARQVAEQHSWRAIAEQHLELYRQAAASGSVRLQSAG